MLIKKNIKSSHKIHLHCFTGSWEIAKKYLKSFPNLCIGVTALITHDYSSNVTELVRNIPIERLLLETDSPFFVPKDVRLFLILNLL